MNLPHISLLALEPITYFGLAIGLFCIGVYIYEVIKNWNKKDKPK